VAKTKAHEERTAALRKTMITLLQETGRLTIESLMDASGCRRRQAYDVIRLAREDCLIRGLVITGCERDSRGVLAPVYGIGERDMPLMRKGRGLIVGRY